jgi:hypothetical protein
MAGNHSRKGSAEAFDSLISGPRSPRGDLPHSNHDWQRKGRYQRSGSTASTTSSTAASLDIPAPNRLGTVTETSQNGTYPKAILDPVLTRQPSPRFCNLRSYEPVFSPTLRLLPPPLTGPLLPETYLRSPWLISRTSTPPTLKRTCPKSGDSTKLDRRNKKSRNPKACDGEAVDRGTRMCQESLHPGLRREVAYRLPKHHPRRGEDPAVECRGAVNSRSHPCPRSRECILTRPFT